MGLKKALFMASLGATALFARAEKNQEMTNDQTKGMYTHVQLGSRDEALPDFIKKFQSLDFDGRMELKETMAQQKGIDFFGALCGMGLSVTAIRRCQEIADYGCEVDTIDPIKNSLATTARKCGFNRLADVLKFHEDKHNEGKFFLELQDAKFRSALLAEEDVFRNGDIFKKYGNDSRVKFNQIMVSEFDHHAQRNIDKLFDGFKDGYHTILEKKVHQKLEKQKQMINSTKQNG